MEVITSVWRIYLLTLCIGVNSASKKNRNLETCEDLAVSNVCSDAGLPYSSTRFPNDFNHFDIRTADDVLLEEYLPLFNSGCSEYIRPFVCSVFFPECRRRRREESIRPCRELCQKARENCKPTFSSYGQSWPAVFECDRFEPYKPKRSRKKGSDNCFNYMPPPPDFCSQPADIGPCNRLTGKFFFDENAQICRSFTYGGCAGNRNRFETKEDCQSVCMRQKTEGNNRPRRPVTEPTIEQETREQDRTFQDENKATTKADVFPTVPSVPPLIVYPPGNHLVKEYGSVTLKCQASGPPPIEYSWNRLDGPMPEEKIMKEETFGPEGLLIIVNMTSEDAGEYLCTAENFEGIVDSIAKVTIYADVKISSTSRVLNVLENDRIEIVCNATGFPEPNVYWRRKAFPDEILTTGNDLIIDAAQSDDTGAYVCEASNVYSKASHEVQVVVSVQIWINLDASFYLKYGVTSAIQCVLEGYPAIEVTWFNENQNKTVPIERFSNREAFLIDKHIYRVTSTLLFHNVTDMDSGKYSCYGSNVAGKKHRSTEVLISGEDCPIPEDVGNSDLGVEGIRHGSRHVYTCKKGYTMVGVPILQCVNGKYNEKPPSCFADCGNQSRFMGTHDYLQHGSTGKLLCHEHLGYYLGGSGHVSCLNGTTIGDSKCYKPPSFQERPVDDYVIENRDIMLKCIPGADDSIITWYRGENEMLLDEKTDEQSRISKAMNGSVLIIKGATAQDAGPYTCKISNPVGTATSTARLTVIGENRLPHIVEPLDPITVYAGENVQLKCANKGDPAPNVTWLFEAAPITTGHSDTLIVDSTLFITKSEAKNSGRYTCVATNTYGTDTANFTLTVLEPSTEPPSPPERIGYVKDPESQLRALLMCPYGGKAEEAVRWTFDDGDLKSTLRHYTVTNRRLIIHDADESDNGIYTCTVHTTKGIQTFRTILTITPSDAIQQKGLIYSGEDEVLSDSGFTNPSARPAEESPEFHTTTIATPPDYTEPQKKHPTKPSLKQADSAPKASSDCSPCSEPKIKPRRRDINDTGLPDYFRGWVDVQGQGAANDYCRLINPSPNQLMLACALAGTQGESQYNYVSTSNLDPGYKETSYMKDEDGDGKDDYCRCVGAGREMYVWCMKASEDGFVGKAAGGRAWPSQYTFVAPGPRSVLRKCRKIKVDPFFGQPV
ncbi:hemicentin-2-like isoform X2 [Antedon mediterranea]|uniref:hemicentin-2-like isoform X2 n=1 Tax=Antedon mediterranea TaxID=105859 RepID=UPI003AF4C01D